MARIAVIFGTRPEAIKMCPLVLTLKKEGFDTDVISTGQHGELLQSAMSAFSVCADVSLCVMREGQTLTELTSSLILHIGRVLAERRPAALLVHGDTCTAFAASLAAFYLDVPVCHVEAGLRTCDVRSPFPEELYRRVISQVACLHFAPTERAGENLIAEGVCKERVFIVGNTVIDALGYTVREGFSHPLLEWGRGGRLLLMTSHRRESIGEPMERIFRAVREVCEEREEARLILPVHPNPRVREIAERVLGGCERIMLCEPLDVKTLHNILARACAVLTDSGGIQEEACALGIPTLVLRDNTERTEGISTGGARLTGTGKDGVKAALLGVLDAPAKEPKPRFLPNPYGDGRSCDKICQILRQKLALFTEL